LGALLPSHKTTRVYSRENIENVNIENVIIENVINKNAFSFPLLCSPLVHLCSVWPLLHHIRTHIPRQRPNSSTHTSLANMAVPRLPTLCSAEDLELTTLRRSEEHCRRRSQSYGDGDAEPTLEEDWHSSAAATSSSRKYLVRSTSAASPTSAGCFQPQEGPSSGIKHAAKHHTTYAMRGHPRDHTAYDDLEEDTLARERVNVTSRRCPRRRSAALEAESLALMIESERLYHARFGSCSAPSWSASSSARSTQDVHFYD